MVRTNHGDRQRRSSIAAPAVVVVSELYQFSRTERSACVEMASSMVFHLSSRVSCSFVQPTVSRASWGSFFKSI